MTTNSPNPVDGDVQELISDCQRDIEEIQYEISTYGDKSGRRASKLKRQQVALAALTAEPEVFISEEGVQALIERINVALKQFTSGRASMHVPPLDTDVDIVLADCEKMLKSFTTPPAQLLRPVELPDCEFGAVSIMSGGSKDYCNGFVDGTQNAIKAIHAAGYEVKND